MDEPHCVHAMPLTWCAICMNKVLPEDNPDEELWDSLDKWWRKKYDDN